MDIEPVTENVRSEKKIREQLAKQSSSTKKRSCLETMAKYVTFFHVEETMKTSVRKYEKEIVHCLAVFQALFYSVSVLNKLLGDVVKLPKISDFYNGVFIYNTIVHITKRPEAVKETALPTDVKTSFQTTYASFISNLPDLQDISAKLKKKKKPRAKPEKATIVDEIDQTESGSEPEYFDVENRFAALKVS